MSRSKTSPRSEGTVSKTECTEGTFVWGVLTLTLMDTEGVDMNDMDGEADRCCKFESLVHIIKANKDQIMLTDLGSGECSEGKGVGTSEGSVDTSLIEMTVGVFEISDDSLELDIDDDDGTILEDGNGAVPEDGDGMVANDGDRAVANDGDGAETNDGDDTVVKDGNGAVLKDGNGDDGTMRLSVTGACLDIVDGCRAVLKDDNGDDGTVKLSSVIGACLDTVDGCRAVLKDGNGDDGTMRLSVTGASLDTVDGCRMDGNGILLIVREGDEEIVLLEGIDGDEGIESDDEIVLSVIGGSLDTDDTTDAVGLKKDVSNDTSPGSPKVTDLIDGEGSNIDDSYEASVSEAHSDSRTDGLETDEGVRRMVGVEVIDVSVTLDGVVVNLEEGSSGGSLRIPLSLGEESLSHVEGERRDCVDNSSVSGKSLDTARLRDDMGALRVDVGALRTDTGGLRTDTGGLRTDTGGL
jgi:hypothetical protein